MMEIHAGKRAPGPIDVEDAYGVFESSLHIDAFF
jgi:hypothetical protein